MRLTGAGLITSKVYPKGCPENFFMTRWRPAT